MDPTCFHHSQVRASVCSRTHKLKSPRDLLICACCGFKLVKGEVFCVLFGVKLIAQGLFLANECKHSLSGASKEIF